MCITIPLLNYAYSNVPVGGHKLLDASQSLQSESSVHFLLPVNKLVEEKVKHCLAGNVTVGI